MKRYFIQYLFLFIIFGANEVHSQYPLRPEDRTYYDSISEVNEVILGYVYTEDLKYDSLSFNTLIIGEWTLYLNQSLSNTFQASPQLYNVTPTYQDDSVIKFTLNKYDSRFVISWRVFTTKIESLGAFALKYELYPRDTIKSVKYKNKDNLEVLLNSEKPILLYTFNNFSSFQKKQIEMLNMIQQRFDINVLVLTNWITDKTIRQRDEYNGSFNVGQIDVTSPIFKFEEMLLWNQIMLIENGIIQLRYLKHNAEVIELISSLLDN